MKIYDIFEKGNIQYIPREKREIIYKICGDNDDTMTFCRRSIFTEISLELELQELELL